MPPQTVTSPPMAAKRTRRKVGLRRREIIDAYVCLSPWLIGMIVFTLVQHQVFIFGFLCCE